MEGHSDRRADFATRVNLDQAVLRKRLAVSSLAGRVVDDNEPVVGVT